MALSRSTWIFGPRFSEDNEEEIKDVFDEADKACNVLISLGLQIVVNSLCCYDRRRKWKLLEETKKRDVIISWRRMDNGVLINYVSIKSDRFLSFENFHWSSINKYKICIARLSSIKLYRVYYNIPINISRIYSNKHCWLNIDLTVIYVNFVSDFYREILETFIARRSYKSYQWENNKRYRSIFYS